MALFRKRRRVVTVKSPALVQGSLHFAWKPLGQITFKSSRLRFPNAPIGPGLYRFRFEGAENARVYIGESKNVSRRFGNYARPGPSQVTNIRLNAAMTDHLDEDGLINVDTCFEVLFGHPKAKKVNLGDKAARRMAENAAIVIAQQHGDSLLNR